MEKNYCSNIGDIQSCTNYHAIKLMGHTMKQWERVTKRRLTQKTKIYENQLDFMPGRSTREAIFSLKQLIKKILRGRKI